MASKRILSILLKEWQILFTDLSSALMVTLLPILIVVQGMLYVWVAMKFGSDSILASPIFQTALEKLVQATPALAQSSSNEKLLVLLLSQFNFFLLLIPAVIAINVAAFSIVDEKLSGSLEALLATPVRTWELLLGKALAGAIPSLVITWFAASIFLLGISVLGWGAQIAMVMNAAWFLSLFVLTPAVAALSFMLGVIGSSRAKDAKSAQSLAIVVIFPMFALIGIQITGLVWFTPLLTLAVAVGLIIADAIVLRIAVRLFRRESILTQWR